MRLLLIATLLLASSGCGCGSSAKLVPVQPCRATAEVCNGIDDDCDGQTDEYEEVTELCDNGCTTQGFRLCADGILQECNARKPRPETCNGYDDDCDGVVDDPESLPVVFCYSGPNQELTHSGAPCRPGILRCSYGRPTCEGQVLPTAEVCNGADDDCDGQTDEGVVKPNELDIVFVIDNSCSMADALDSVRQVVIGFQSKYASRPDLRWALVTAPDRDWNLGATPTLRSDFTGPSAFSSIVSQQVPSGSGTEATIDAIDQLIDPANPLKLTWKPGNKKSIVILSDEEPQAVTSPETYQTMAAKIANVPFLPLADVRVFTDLTRFVVHYEWKQIVGAGNTYNVRADPATMAANLEKIIVDNSCIP